MTGAALSTSGDEYVMSPLEPLFAAGHLPPPSWGLETGTSATAAIEEQRHGHVSLCPHHPTWPNGALKLLMLSRTQVPCSTLGTKKGKCDFEAFQAVGRWLGLPPPACRA